MFRFLTKNLILFLLLASFSGATFLSQEPNVRSRPEVMAGAMNLGLGTARFGQGLPGPSGLPQYTAAGHVLGFRKDGVVIASASHALRVEFVNARPASPVEEGKPSESLKGHRAAQPLGKVTYRDLWDRISLVYEKTESGVVESSYYVQPGGAEACNPVDEIRLRYNVPVKVDGSGNLVLSFSTGEMKETRPVAWQEVGGKRVAVEAGYRLLGAQEAGFTVGPYDPRYLLVIDPVLTWNTFLGGTGNDVPYGIAVDTKGNIDVTGYSTASWGTPVIRSFTVTGGQDAFVAQLNNSGVLQWNTFLGGTGTDDGYGIAVDSSDNIYLTGWSTATWGSPVRDFTGGQDAFVAKLNNSGALQWNTFLGGDGTDAGYGVAVDSSDNIYLTGWSDTTWGSPVRDFTGGQDAFVAKLNNSGALQWNTFLGGTGIWNVGYGIAVDSSGNIYLTGWSDTTWGSPVRDFSGIYAAFVAKLDKNGVLQWNSFLNGTGVSHSYGIAVDSSGNTYVTGDSTGTWGEDSPVMAFSGSQDAFVAKLDGSGNLLWYTFLGTGTSEGYGIAMDPSGNICVTGDSSWTWGSPGRAYTGFQDAFVAKLDGSGNLLGNAFLGGTMGEDYGSGIAVDKNGNVYAAGWSDRTWGDSPSPVRAYSAALDAFVAATQAIALQLMSLSVSPASGTYGGGAVDLSATLTSYGAKLSNEPISFSVNGGASVIANTDSSGVATVTGFSIAGLAPGQYPISASFYGDANYPPCVGTGILTVAQTPTSLTAADAGAWFIAQHTQPVNLTATVTLPAGMTATGSVTFTVLGQSVSGVLYNNIATAIYTLPANTPVGSYIISASYPGTTDLGPSSAIATLVVLQANTDLAITSFTIDPTVQSANPTSIRMAAVVTNIGNQLATDVTVQFAWTNPSPLNYQALSSQYFGEIPPGGTGTVYADWTDGRSPVVIQASVGSTSLDTNQSNNVATLQLDGLYFTDNTPGSFSTSDHTLNLVRDGYNFVNAGGSVDWGLFSDTFGQNNVYDSYSVHGTTVYFIDPKAQLFFDNIWQPWFGPGNCYGMSTTSLNFWQGVQNVQSFSPAATSVYTMQMQTPYNVNDLTWRNIERYQGTFLGYQVLNQVLNQMELSDLNVHPMAALTNLEAQMKSSNTSTGTSDPNILILMDNASLTGHAVVPYRIVQTPTSADIYVYDNYFPGDATHAVNVNLQNNTWSYSSSQFSGSGSWGLFGVPRSLNDAQPILPYTYIANLLFIDFTLGGGTVQNTNSVGAAVGTKVKPIGGSSFPGIYVLPVGEYVTTLSGTGTGSATAGFLRSSAALTFTSQNITLDTRDTIIFSQDGNTVTLGTNVANEHYTTTLFQDLGTSTREYTVGNTTMASTETIRLALINGGTSFEIINHGNPKTYDLTLTQVGAGAATISLTGLAIGAGETDIFTVSDWTNLPTTEVDLQVLDSQGKSVTTKSLQLTFADAQRKTQLTVNTLDKLFRFLAPGFDSGVITAPKMKVININPSNPSVVMTYNKQTKTWQPDLSKLGAPPAAAAWISQCKFSVVPKELIIIPYEDKNILFFAVAAHSTTNRCVAFLLQKSTGKVYLLIE